MATVAQKRGLQGVSSLRRKLRRMPDDVRAIVQKAIVDGAELVKFHQLKNVPVDEGDLAASIEIKLGGDKLSAEIGPGARTTKAKRAAGWRSHFVEFGTAAHGKHPGTRPQPFIRSALKENVDEVTKMIDAAVDTALKKASEGGG